MKIFDWLTDLGNSLGRSFRPSRRRRRRQKSGVAVEMLEMRTLLSAPTFSPTSYGYAIDEDAQSGALLGTLSATDADEDPLTFSITDGDPDGAFYVDSTGQLTLMGELDYETTAAYSLTVEVSDGTETDTATVNVTVNDVAEAPVFNPTTYNWAVDEDADMGTALGTLSAGDPQGDELTYSIVDGDPEGMFYVDSTGQLTLMGELDYETTAAYTLTVEVSDGTETDTATVNVTVNDVAEAPVFNPSTYNWAVDEDAGMGTALGTLSAGDPQGDELTYSIVDGDPEEVFYVDSTGQLLVMGELDYETTAAFTLTVEVSDGTETDTATVNVTINDVAEAPIMGQSSYTFNVNEDANISTSLGAVSATDPQGDEISYSILSGNEEGMFWIDEATGDIMIGSELDYEATSVYVLTVMASDGTSFDTATVTINILDVNEAPVITQFTATEGENGDWIFAGIVEDEDGIFAGMIITFGGILDGHSTTVNADGTFAYIVNNPSAGMVTAQATDNGGLASNVAEHWVYFT